MSLHPTLVKRVETLEITVEPLADLPRRMDNVEARVAAVETQILQLRAEVRDEFSATRAAIKEGDDAVRADLLAEIKQSANSLRAAIKEGDDAVRADLREEIRTLGIGLRAEIKEVDEGLHREIVQGAEQTRAMIRVLHKDIRAMHIDLAEKIDAVRKRH